MILKLFLNHSLEYRRVILMKSLAEEFGLTLRRLIQIKDSILAKLKNNSELVEFYKG